MSALLTSEPELDDPAPVAVAPARERRRAPRASRGSRELPAVAGGDEAGALQALFAREKQLLQRQRHAQAVRVRYGLAAIGLALAGADVVADLFVAPWRLLLALALGIMVLNGLADLLRRAGRDAPWHFWALMAGDTLTIAVAVAALGAYGYLVAPFVVAASGAYGLGLPRAARVQLALGVLLYPIARLLGYASLLVEPPFALIAMETGCLLGVGWIVIRGPIQHTYRVRRARRALAALESGDFSSRLPARVLDDLGFLAVSFNSTAVTLGDMVEALRTQIAERQRAEAELAHQAYHDPLTSLANRARFRERVEDALRRAGADVERVTVLFIDLDGFKRVNDSLGHAVGDRLLVMVADRLLNATRGSDTVARLGGDEFAVLLENVRDIVDAERVAERIGHALASPFAVEGAALVVAASVGIARATSGDEATDEAAVRGEGDDIARRAVALLRDADVAMYQAKAHGKGGYEVFAPHMHAVAIERLALEAELRQALEAEELHLAYQPIVDLADGRIIGVEALARWDHPRRGPLAPDVFIPVAEETGLILPIGRWVLHEACRRAVHWRATAGPDFHVAVNVSGRQVQHGDLVADVAAALAASGLPAEALLLEITETALMQDTATTLQRLTELKALGVRIAIDDFGTGYSSLGYLQRLPVDVLKIDRSFVGGIGSATRDTALARTILGLGSTLAMRCVAEGVEDPRQHDQLRALGCELGQGFLFSRPVGADEVGALLGG